MTVDKTVLFMFVFLVVFVLYQSWQAANRCSYCGKVGGHDNDCPRQL